LGRPAGSVDDLFFASQLPLQVRTVPRRAEAPLHVFANKEAIYVTCEGASLLGRAAQLLTAQEAMGSSAVNMTLSPAAFGEQFPAELLKPPIPVETPAAPLEPDITALESKGETSVAEMLLPEPSGQSASFVAYRQPLRLLQSIDETERLTARLKYLCRRIARQRHPYCSVNGLLILTPLAATDNDADAHQIGLIIQRDIRAARASLRVRCPIETTLCDLERLPGFLDLMAQFTEARQRQQLLGRTFPLVPQVDPEQFPKMISAGLEWLCQTMLPSVVYQFLQTEKPGDANAEETLRRNGRLVYMLGQLRDRQPRWSHILTQGVTMQEKQTPLLGGAFLCATGPDAAREQAFVHDVFRLLIENQNAVAWTPEALDENRDYVRWTRLCYLGIALLAAGFVFLAYHIWLNV
ncbi:MAG: type VI secretion protein IcmF/TssM N-terminal domain-containing protein, partial [Bradyrhizobium sp.]